MIVKRYKNKSERRKIRVRSRIRGTKVQPRLSVFRSNKYISAQLIDDSRGETLAAASEKDLITDKKGESQKASKTERARFVGKVLAEKALKKGIKTVVFDRGSYKYHGRVRALAEGAREGGLKF